ncbi:ComEC/Rec2 family competence protein [Dyadobacter luticola]|uniref:ComEC family competence protein n=1 Tax=Dyadobacter luticola TaxID=1979387 RepID=A0A5R9L3K8_9BACT|nr:ComEC/Rec2 family competence protein [Dyadobacter luticola]TLV02991.1 ComEC family competence protein [Dyadobacter luticola]
MLSRAPFVGIALYLISGIVIGDWLFGQFSMSSLVPGFMLVVLLVIFLFYYFKKKKLASGVSLAAFFILLGAFSNINVEEKRDAETRLLGVVAYDFYEARVTSLPEKRSKSVRMEVTVDRLKLRSGAWMNVDLKALINIDSKAAQIPRPGDLIIVRGNLNRPIEASNPDQFDYRRYLRNKGILWTAYLPEHSFYMVDQNGVPRTLGLLSLQVSDWADQVFRKQIRNDQSYGLVKAMLLGRRDDLGEAQVDSYIASGTVHILSVSGMHVAIIFLSISYLLGWIKRFRFGNLLYLLLVIGLLGFYALATGFSPCVQRATVMCIVFVFAEVFKRQNNAMNTLAISAFLILLFDPSALYDVGFQLSYLAMSGIFLLFEPISNILKPDNRILKFIWQVTAMSFAAQLVTFPLSIYYFHQFPTYFWLVNPFVIAFTNVLLPAAMALLLASLTGLSLLQEIAAFIVDWSARLTDISVKIPEQLPQFLITNLHFSKPEMWLFYAMLFLIWYALHSRDYQYLKYAFASIFLFSAIAVSQSIFIYFSDTHIVHAVPKHAVRSFKDGNSLYVVSDATFPSDTNAFDFYLKNYVVNQEIENVISITAD